MTSSADKRPVLEVADARGLSPTNLLIGCGDFLAAWECGIANDSIIYVLEIFEAHLAKTISSKQVQSEAMDGLTPEVVRAIRHYFEGAKKNCPERLIYRLEQALRGKMDVPIRKLREGSLPSVNPISACLIHLSFLLEQLKILPQKIGSNQLEIFQDSIKPGARQLILRDGMKYGWSEVKAEKAVDLMDQLCDRFSEDYEAHYERQETIQELFAPLLQMIPIAKISRMRAEGREREINNWFERNREDLVSLKDFMKLFLDRFQRFYLSRESWTITPFLLSTFCNSEKLDFEAISIKDALKQYQNYTAQDFGSSILEPTLEKYYEESGKDLLIKIRSFDPGLRTFHYYCNSGNQLLDWLFARIEIEHQREQEQKAAEMSLDTSSSSRGSKRRGRGAKKQVRPSSRTRIVSKTVKTESLQSSSSGQSITPVAEEKSLQPFVAEDPLAKLHDQLLEGVGNYRNFENFFANQCWKNVEDLYKDLFAELVDMPDPRNCQHVSEYVNRVVVLLSLLAEQMVSTHALEDRQAKDMIDRHKIVSHDTNRMLARGSLRSRFSEQREVLEAVNNLEILSRNLRSHQPRESAGARLLYAADALARNVSGTSSEVILAETKQLVFEQLSMFCQVLGLKVDLAPLMDLSPSPNASTNAENRRVGALLEKTTQMQGRMRALLSSASSSSSRPTRSFLNDASRFLELIEGRLGRHSENGNVRNFFKMLATSIASTLEFTAVTLAGKMGRRDLSQMEWDQFSHGLTNLFEELGFHRLAHEEEEFLERCDRIHSFTRYSANYQAIEQRNSAQDFYLQLLKRIQGSDAMHHGGISQAAWQSADLKLRNAVKAAVKDIYDHLEIGLGLLGKLLNELEKD